MTAGMFEFMAADESQARQARNSALHLAQARVERNLGAFLAKAQNADEYEARFQMVADTFQGLVDVACQESGQDNSQAIAASLKDHFRPVASYRCKCEHCGNEWQSDEQNPETCPRCGSLGEHETSDSEDEDDKKSSSVNGGQAVPPLVQAAKKEKKDFDPSDQTPPEGAPTALDALDSEDSGFDGKDKTAAGFDPHGNPDQYHICQNCGGDYHEDGSGRCPHCGHDDRLQQGLDQFGDELGRSLMPGHQAAEKQDNTGLGDVDGPSMNKGKGTVEKYKEESKRWPVVEKDPIEAIKAENADPLKEIGEKVTDTQKLPTATGEGDSGFANGGESKGPSTETWHGNDGQTDPVKSETLEKAAGKEHWIQDAVKKPGDLHKKLHVPEGEKIPEEKIENAEKSGDKNLKEKAQFAENVKKGSALRWSNVVSFYPGEYGNSDQELAYMNEMNPIDYRDDIEREHDQGLHAHLPKPECPSCGIHSPQEYETPEDKMHREESEAEMRGENAWRNY